MVISLSDGYVITLDYYKVVVDKRVDLKIKVKRGAQCNSTLLRGTVDYYAISKTFDKKKLKAATRANVMHALDAFYFRDIQKRANCAYLTIHDCALVDYLSVTKLILHANTSIKESGFLVALSLKQPPYVVPVDSFSLFILK